MFVALGTVTLLLGVDFLAKYAVNLALRLDIAALFVFLGKYRLDLGRSLGPAVYGISFSHCYEEIFYACIGDGRRHTIGP